MNGLGDTRATRARKLTVGIAGAGIAGRLIALYLLDRGHEVTLFDRDPHDAGDECNHLDSIHEFPRYSACSYTAAGMLTPYSEAETAEPLVYQLGIDSLRLWPGIVARLNGEVYYRTGGSLVVAHRQDRPDLDRFVRMVKGALDPDERQFSLIDGALIAELEPELAGRFEHAAYAPDESWLCPCCLMPVLRDALLDGGVRWRPGQHVSGVLPGRIAIDGVSGERSYGFDLVLDCRGLGAKEDIPQLRGVRGEIIWVEAPDVRIQRLVRLMHPRYRIYIVPRRDALYVIGATQIESEDYSGISVRSTLELLSAAYSVHPGFGEARVVKTDANCRPALADNQPNVARCEGLMRINGLFRHGFLMGPAIAAEVAAIAEEGGGYVPKYEGLVSNFTYGESSRMSDAKGVAGKAL